MPGHPSQKSSGALVAAIERAKQHPFVVVATSLLAVVVFFSTVTQLFESVSHRVHEARNPFEREYKQLSMLEVGASRGAVEQAFGTARKSARLCELVECSPTVENRDLSINLYTSSRIEVRVIYGNESLEWYAITTLSDELQPPMNWLGYSLGRLGEATYQEALDGPTLSPTDTDMFLGPQSSAYVEIFSGGAPAHYRGLIFASAPYGRSGADSFDRDESEKMVRLNEGDFDSAVARPFRSRSRPNTFGLFNDDVDEALGSLFRSAEWNRVLLYAFADAG